MDPVALDLHPSAPPVAALAACQVLVDVALRQRQTGGNAVDNRDQGLTVGLALGEEAKQPAHRYFFWVAGVAWAVSVLRTDGVMKMTSSLPSLLVEVVLNSQPRTGMSPKSGTFRV